MAFTICYQDQRQEIHDCDFKLAERLFEQIQNYPEHADIASQMKRNSKMEGNGVVSQEFHFPTIESRDSFLMLLNLQKGSGHDYIQKTLISPEKSRDSFFNLKRIEGLMKDSGQDYNEKTPISPEESRDSFLKRVEDLMKDSGQDYNENKLPDTNPESNVSPKTKTQGRVTTLDTLKSASHHARRSGVHTLSTLRNPPLYTISRGERLGGNVENSTTSMRERVLKATEERMKSQTPESEISNKKP